MRRIQASKGIAITLMIGAGCGPGDRPTKESADAYRAAQAAVDAKIEDARSAFEAAASEIREGRWVPREDLGKCKADLPMYPNSKDHYEMAFVTSRRDWGALTDDVFAKMRAAVGKVAAPETFTSEQELRSATTRLKELDVEGVKNALIGVVDESVEPKQQGKDTFSGGHERGRIWLWSFRKRAVLCASVYDATSSESVEVYKSNVMDTNQQLGADLFGHARDNAVKSLFVAGPPK